MLSSASQNSTTHVNSAHSQTGSHINTILLLSEHLKYEWKEKRNNCLSLSNPSFLFPELYTFQVTFPVAIVYNYCCLHHSCVKLCQIHILPFVILSVYTSTLLELVTLKKTDQCETNLTMVSAAGLYEQVLS